MPGYALRDAIECINPTPVVECHISNVYAREVRRGDARPPLILRQEFRHKSVTSPVVAGYIAGVGTQTYSLGLRACIVRAAEVKASQG